MVCDPVANRPGNGLNLVQEDVAGVPAGQKEVLKLVDTVRAAVLSSVNCTEPVGVPPVVEVTTTRNDTEPPFTASLSGVAASVVKLVAFAFRMVSVPLAKSTAGKS